MNRRELLGKVVGALAGAGVSAEVKALEAEPPPLALVITPPEPLPPAQIEAMRDALGEAFKGRMPCPVIVAEPGMEIRAVRDPGLNEVR